jgi:hypothetical protein
MLSKTDHIFPKILRVWRTQFTVLLSWSLDGFMLMAIIMESHVHTMMPPGQFSSPELLAYLMGSDFSGFVSFSLAWLSFLTPVTL